MWPQDVPRERAGRQETGGDAAGGEPRLFRYTPTVSQPLSVPPQAWPDDDPAAMPGFEFDDWTQNAAPPDAIPLGAPGQGDQRGQGVQGGQGSQGAGVGPN